MRHELSALPGLTWHENGQCTISGALLEAFHSLDTLFLGLAALRKAEAHRFPSFISAAVLQRLEYLRSFPHLATFPVTLDADPENLASFASTDPLDADGCLQLARVSPIRDVLTPAACYHCYPRLQGQVLNGPRYMTTLATCYRRESEYLPLQRQWSFSMREIVCIGGALEVQEFLGDFRARIDALTRRLGLPVSFEHATDPFFSPRRNPKYVAQKLDPLKTEVVLKGGLAIGSLNYHRSHFGDAFGIMRDAQPSDSGCVAFGLERWLYALFATHGPDIANWPPLHEAN